MKLQFKRQQFQADAARAVCGVFAGQPAFSAQYAFDPGKNNILTGMNVGWRNQPIILPDAAILANLNRVQLQGGIKPSPKLMRSESCDLNLTVEMETGVGKTYTYIKTMFELNKAYGWRKFIVIVPSVAIREGVYKTFQITQDHFAEEYGEKIRFFIYNSATLAEIGRFAQDSGINAMIINAQAFNARGKDARRIDMRLDSFGSRKPIDALAATNPILIIDEPQSVEGKATREKLAKFHPMLTLRYSATHKPDSLYNMVYRLDAQDAYNKRLVKKIEVKGFRQSGATASAGYIYLEAVNISSANPTVALEFDHKGKNGVSRKRRICREGDNLYEFSNCLEEYKDGYVISRIDARDNHIEFVNGIKLTAGEMAGHVEEGHLRRLQIRETILTHLAREERNFARGIKTLSLFFIDEVAKYRVYDKNDAPANGEYAAMFEEEYQKALAEREASLCANPQYEAWLKSQPVAKSHAGYFSIDKKGKKFVNSGLKRGQTNSDDVDAYDLIMKNRERLLDLNEPARFIFSHSALREGWDNPNVFQICALKQSASDVRKRQEVGRGMRLCVNSQGERMDEDRIGPLANDLNVLTVIASESYENFSRGLQTELAEAVSLRPKTVEAALFEGHELKDQNGSVLKITRQLALKINDDLIKKGYVAMGQFTEKYWQDRKNDDLALLEDVAPYYAAMLAILDSVHDPNALRPVNARDNNVSMTLDKAKRDSEAFRKLWAQISPKSAYTVNFSESELIDKAIAALNRNLHTQKIYFTVQTGRLENIASREQLEAGKSFIQFGEEEKKLPVGAESSIKYDLLGKIVAETNLTRATVAAILKGMAPDVFSQYHDNPEDFIIKASHIINNEKASIIIEHITYNKLDSAYNADIFTDPAMRGQLEKNAIRARKHLYDYVIYDSDTERKFAEKLDMENNAVKIYVKLPKKFYISTPVGKYSPDWAIAFHDGQVKHIYFVAETKGSLDSLKLRPVEAAKIACARKHFEALNSDSVKYDVVENYTDLLNKIML